MRGWMWFGVAACAAQVQAAPADNAARFGARESAWGASLSPDGSRMAYLSATPGRGTALVVLTLDANPQPKVALRTSGKPEELAWCNWASNTRLVCTATAMTQTGVGLTPFSRVLAVDADGANLKLLSTRQGFNDRGMQLNGGEVIDWLPDEDGAVLMGRNYLANDTIDSHIGSDRSGYAVDRIDTRTLKVAQVEAPRPRADQYISDGHGAVRIVGLIGYDSSGYQTGVETYLYRRKGSRTWETLSQVRSVGVRGGFDPWTVDRERDVAYGFDRLDGRQALYTMSLDGNMTKILVFARPDVDVTGLLRIGRRNRVVGVSFATDTRQVVYFDKDLAALRDKLARALPKQPNVRIADASGNERKLLLFAGSDSDPGAYYLLDRDTQQLRPLIAARPELDGVALAAMKPVTYAAADGTKIPAYLTLPPGRESAKGLPAIVLPHGGPADRDQWGFDWLPQYYAAQGYAVLQPEFRGSTGYGDAWFQKNGFQSWRTAVGDVVDAGRWLVAQGVADPKKLAIVGWSYGGYAALQSAVLAPDLYKAVVAIAPVTDLGQMAGAWAGFDNEQLVRGYVGTGIDVLRAGSPAQNVAKIKVPVLLIHGTMDRNVAIAQSTGMASRLRAAGGKVELMTFDGLDHQLDDDAARAKFLGASDAFLRAEGS